MEISLTPISYTPGNLESQAGAYQSLAGNLSTLLGTLDEIMNTQVLNSIAGQARGDFLTKYNQSRELVGKYPEKINQVGLALDEAARTGKAVDNSLIEDGIDLNFYVEA